MIRTKMALGFVAAMLSTSVLAQNYAPGDIQQGMERAVAKAPEGPMALRMFLFNSRGVYGLDYATVVREYERRKMGTQKAESAPQTVIAQAERGN